MAKKNSKKLLEFQLDNCEALLKRCVAEFKAIRTFGTHVGRLPEDIEAVMELHKRAREEQNNG